MADTIPNTRAEFLDDDPFAELTRIMGHDPREQRGQEPVQPTEKAAVESDPEIDFNVDLEAELMGDLDLAGFDQPEAALDQQQPVADWRDHEEPVAHEIVDAGPHATPEPDAYYPSHTNEAGVAPVEAETYGYDHDAPVQAFAEPVFEDEDFGSMLERELMGEPDEAPVSQVAFDEPAFGAAAVEPEVAASFEAPEPEPTVGEPDFDLSFLEEEIARASVAADPAEYTASEPAMFAAEAETSDVWQATVTPDPDAQVEQDDIDLDIDLMMDDAFDTAAPAPSDAPDTYPHEPEAYREPEPVQVEPVSWQAPPVAAAPVEQPSYAPPQPAELSLEDELNALLSGEASAPAVAAHQEAWHPPVNTFGRANLTAAAAPVSSWPREPEAEPTYEAPASVSVEQQAADDSADFSDIFGHDFTLEVDEQPEPQAVQYDEPRQHEPLVEEPRYETPAPQPIVASAVTAGLAALSQWQPASARTSVHADAPEVETVDVIEKAPAAVDDLDIPEIDYAAPEERPYDDLGNIEAEFAQAFGDFAPAEQPQPDYGVAESADAAQSADVALDAYALGEGAWQPASQNDEFDYDADFDQAVAMSSFEGEAPPPQEAGPRRGLVLAAIVAGVALVAGAGAIGMSFLGGGSDGPAMVRADSEPMKVRPENPGGTTVPNQDSQAYQRVVGGPQDGAPGQERLISTAEEPVDVTAQAEPPALAPGIEDELSAGLPTEDTPAIDTAKSEARLEPAQSSADAPDEIAAVAPRRVRTMVVRPDGTLVPREDPAPAAAPAPQQQLEAAAPAPALPQTETSGDGVAAVGEVEDSAPTVDIPATVAVVPSRRVEPQAAAPAPVQQPAPQQQAAVQPPAATPVSVPAAAAPAGATSEWSMQIASQPTAEAAQATYQDLARRYGGVLQGRGVNVVRADIEGMGTYYRVRIPASSRDEAIQLCSRYKAAGGSCFVSR